VTYLHPCFERSLAKTLGVPLFQEQLMQMAIDAAGFSAAEADQLRQAMGSKRSASRMERLRSRLYAGWPSGDHRQVADTVWEQLRHSPTSASGKPLGVLRLPRICERVVEAVLPGSIPRSTSQLPADGFWAPHTLVADARRHGVVVLARM